MTFYILSRISHLATALLHHRDVMPYMQCTWENKILIVAWWWSDVSKYITSLTYHWKKIPYSVKSGQHAHAASASGVCVLSCLYQDVYASCRACNLRCNLSQHSAIYYSRNLRSPHDIHPPCSTLKLYNDIHRKIKAYDHQCCMIPSRNCNCCACMVHLIVIGC